jgi:hypothetical protein
MAASVHAMRGEIAEAVDIVLDKINSESVATNLGWRYAATVPHFAEVMSDARVQAALGRWEAEENELRAEVRAYLADLQAAS